MKDFTDRQTVCKKIYIGKSPIAGRGVFAAQDIRKGELIFYIKGCIKHLRVENVSEAQMGPDWVGLSRYTWIDPLPPAKFLNHSCKPSAGIKGRVSLRAMRDIAKGEEITIDYSTTESTELWDMSCFCGTRNCRKIVKSIQFLPKQIFNQYVPYVPSYFQKVYKSYYGNKSYGRGK